MKSNKEKVYDFIRLHSEGENEEGISTVYIADAMEMQRTNVSSILNCLVKEGRISKSEGRPVLYRTKNPGEDRHADCFADLIGCDGSLKRVIQLAKAAVLYPQRSLNTLLVGVRGTGKSRLARRMYQFAQDSGVIAGDAPYLHIDCHDYLANEKLEAELEEVWRTAENGVVFLDNAQFLSRRARKKVLAYIRSETRNYAVLVSCTDKEQLADEFLAEFPVQLELPALSERPLEERMEMIKHLFSKEAVRIKRPLIVRGDLMNCLLLYECEANYYQLKGDIKIGCANAYVREYQGSGEIPLFISDFSNNVRRGLLQRRGDADTMIDFDRRFVFDGNKVSISLPEGGTLYDKLSKKASELRDTGLGEEEINMLLSVEVERAFGAYQKKLVRDVADKKQLEVLVDERLIRIVEEFLQRAEQKLNRSFSESVLYGLCLHINAVVSGKRETIHPDKKQIAEVLVYHKAEYLLGEELAEQIGTELHMEFPADEIIFLTLFLCYQSPEAAHTARPVLLTAFYGEGIASAIAKTISGITGLDNVFSFEITCERASAGVYDALRERLTAINRGRGILVLYDSSFLGEMLMELENELEIPIRQIPMPVTTLGIELARRTLTEDDPDKVLRYAAKSVGTAGACGRSYIVTLCTTGKGGAEELKHYIERYGQLWDTEIIPLSITDRGVLEDNLRRLMTTGVIRCVIGTYDPKLFSIPFLSISEVFGAGKEHLPQLLRMEREAKAGIDYDAMFAYLEEQLSHTDMVKLRKVLPEVMRSMNEALGELTLDAEAGLLVHMACCVDRLQGKEPVAANPRKSAILFRYEKEFKQLLKLVKPLEKTFHIIINDDEIANILTIIYQL